MPGEATARRRRLFSFRTLLYIATVPVALISFVIVVSAAWQHDWWISAYFGFAYAFYGGLALAAPRLTEAASRRWWMAVAASVAVFLTLFGVVGLGSVVIFGPSWAVFVWLAARG